VPVLLTEAAAQAPGRPRSSRCGSGMPPVGLLDRVTRCASRSFRCFAADGAPQGDRTSAERPAAGDAYAAFPHPAPGDVDGAGGLLRLSVPGCRERGPEPPACRRPGLPGAGSARRVLPGLATPCRRRRRTRTRTRRAGASRTTGAFMPLLTGSTSGTRTPPSPAGPRHIRGPRSAGWSRSTTILTTVASGRRRSCSSVPVPYVA
jgi:hypothetical protein